MTAIDHYKFGGNTKISMINDLCREATGIDWTKVQYNETRMLMRRPRNRLTAAE